jgi:hypothetical protein
MKESISTQERLLLATLILAGLCANPYHRYSPVHHVLLSVQLLNRLLTVIDDQEVAK